MLRVNDDWLKDYSKRTGKGHKAQTSLKRKTNLLGEIEKAQREAKKDSPHLSALKALDKNPELLKNNQEHYDQVRVFWHFEQHHPDIYVRLMATPNGGWRGKKAGGYMTAEGQKKGYPDMSLDAPRGIYHGMRIELKYGQNSLSCEQKEYLNLLRSEGYHCVYCVGWMEAVEAIMAYWYTQPGETLPQRERDMKWAA